MTFVELVADLLEDADGDIDVVFVRSPPLLAHDTANDDLEKGVSVFVADGDPFVVRELVGDLLDLSLRDGPVFAVYEGDLEEAFV